MISETFGIRFIKNSTDQFVKNFQKIVISNASLEYTKVLQKIKDLKVMTLRSKDLYIDKKNDDVYKFGKCLKLYIEICGVRGFNEIAISRGILKSL